MVPLVLVLFVMVSSSRAQDFSSLLAQGQEGGLSLEQVVSALRQRGMLDQVSQGYCNSSFQELERFV